MLKSLLCLCGNLYSANSNTETDLFIFETDNRTMS